MLALVLVAGPAAAQNPDIDSVTPSTGGFLTIPTAAATSFTLGLSGTSFSSSSTILLNGEPQATRFDSQNTLRVQLPFSTLLGDTAATAGLAVADPSGLSAPTTFHFLDANPAAVVVTTSTVTIELTAASTFFSPPFHVPTMMNVSGSISGLSTIVFLSPTQARVTIPSIGDPRRAVIFVTTDNPATTGAALLDVLEARPTLTVVKTGGGTGTISSSPGGISNCINTCSAQIQLTSTSGTPVTLTATPTGGSTFAGWFGGGCSGTGSCTLNLREATTVSAVFVPAGTQQVTAPIFAAVLPSSRSVQVGTTATAFATIINQGPVPARGCGLGINPSVPGTFTFRATDPATNATIGELNAPIDIPAGGFGTFIFALTPTLPSNATDAVITFDCANSAPAASMTGINTLLLAAALPPAPDVVALAATLGGNGIVDVPVGGTGVFAVATVNVAYQGGITASADTGGVPLPISLFLCQTEPASGQCVSQ
ncbi:MAG: hypothetical protein ACREK6_05965, partial [Candidatus Rokuibacteriota bacterium]